MDDHIECKDRDLVLPEDFFPRKMDKPGWHFKLEQDNEGFTLYSPDGMWVVDASMFEKDGIVRLRTGSSVDIQYCFGRTDEYLDSRVEYKIRKVSNE